MEELPFSKLIFAQLVNKFPEFLVPESSFLCLQTSAIVMYPKPHRSVLPNHQFKRTYPSSSVSAKWILPLDISALFHIHLRTPAHATCPECLHSCFYKPLLLDCTLNQISQFSVITQFGVLVYLLLCLPSGFVLVDISTLFYMHLHTPTHATCPRYFNVLV